MKGRIFTVWFVNPITFPFDVSPEYIRTFMLEVGGYQYGIVVNGNQIFMDESGDICPCGTEGMVLDFIADSIMAVRKELGK